jgi:hypothetical protein
MMSLELRIAALANKPASEATFREDAAIKLICAFGESISTTTAIEKVDAAIMLLAEKSPTVESDIQKRIAAFLRKTSCQAQDWRANQILKIIDGTYVEE